LSVDSEELARKRSCTQFAIAAHFKASSLFAAHRQFRRNAPANDTPRTSDTPPTSGALGLIGLPLITISNLAKKCSTTFPTAKKDIDKLVSLGILHESPRGTKPTYYMAREYFAAAYVVKD
jgi:Fic family protein